MFIYIIYIDIEYWQEYSFHEKKALLVQTDSSKEKITSAHKTD